MSSETPGAESAEPLIDWEAVARYLAGESPAGERDRIQQWFASRPGEAKVMTALDDALKGLTLGRAATDAVDVEAALAKVNHLKAMDDARPIPGIAPGVAPGVPARKVRFALPSGFRPEWIKLAAAASLVIGIGALVWGGRGSSDEAQVIASRTFTTGVGGRDSLQLPDGSSVVLGPGSHLTLAAGYGQQTRNLVLEGEAYFEVKHDSARPFVVTANGATIRDVGTSFGIHADSTGDVRVAVRSGVVELSRATSPGAAVLHAGDVGVASQSGGVVTQRGAGTDDDLAWTRGQLIFRDATMAEVRDDLRRWFGIELVAGDSALLRRHLTATFSGRDSSSTVLRNIALSLPATIERHGDTAIVRLTPETRRRK